MNHQEQNKQQEKIEKLAREIIDLCRSSLIVNLRFIDMAVSRLTLLPQGTERTATDGEHYFYNPIHILRSYKKARELPIRRYLHTVFHCIYRHMFIGTLKDNRLWNLACDIAVEHSINGLSLDVVTIKKAEEQEKEIEQWEEEVRYVTAEMLYRHFLDHPPTEETLQRLEKLFSLDDHSIWYYSPEQIAAVRKGGTNASEKKDSSNDGDNDTDKMDNSDIERFMNSRRELESMWQNVSEYVQTALETIEQERGQKAGNMIQNLKEVNRERYDYTTFLKKFAVMGEAMKINDDEFDYVYYTYGLELYRNMPLVEPLEYKEVKRIREFVIAIDTSGSVEGDLVQKFIQKTYNILKSSESFFAKINLHIVQCDAKIQQDTKITSQEEFDEFIKNMKLFGFGGTDFRPVFHYVNQLIEQKEFTNLRGLIYFTDGYGTFPETQPPYETAFVFIDQGYENPEVPVWAIRLVLEKEDLT